MLTEIIKNRSRIHTRDIMHATYPHSDSRIIVHGVLKERRYMKIFNITGDIPEPGIVHYLDVKLLIKSGPQNKKA